MKLAEANEKLNRLSYIKFSELFSDFDLETIILNKGKSGQLLELALDMKLSNSNLDFEDGELKTNKCDAAGQPLETIFITQISSVIDDLLNCIPFENTHLYEKINNILYVPVCKVGEPKDWMFLPSTQINLNSPEFFELKKELENDYYLICNQLRNHIETSSDGFIHTSNGRYIQIRSKDSKPYNPIYSRFYGRYVSNKNHAFYFKKDFIKRIKGL